MLKAFRDNLKHLKWLLILVIAAFVLAIFAVWGGGVQDGATPNAAVATLGRTEVTGAEFRREYQRLEGEAKATWGDAFTSELAGQLGLTQRALERVITTKILIEEAEAIGLESTEAEIRDAIKSIPIFTDADGRFIGQEAYRQALNRGALGTRYSVGDFEDEIRRDLLRDKFIDVVSRSVYVSSEDVEHAYREDVDKAEIQYLQLPIDRFADQVSSERADLERYFESHQADYQLPERRRVSYVLLEPRLLQSKIEIEEAEVRAYYDNNQSEFTREERVRARHILRLASGPDNLAGVRTEIEDLRRRIEAGEDFAALAREFSEDEATRDSGGELGFFSRGRYNPALEEAAFGGRVGELLGPIESNLINRTGLHLIEVQSRQAGGVEDYEVAQIAIRSRLLNERSRSRAESEAEELSRRVRNEDLDIAGLESFSNGEEAASFRSLEPFAGDDNVLGIGRGTAFTMTAFLLEAGEISEPIELSSGWALLYLEEVLESRTATLDEVDVEVAQALRLELQQTAASETLEALVEQIRGGLTMAAAAESMDLELQDSGDFGRDGFISGLGRQTELTYAVFDLSVGDVGGPFTTDGGSVVFQVVERTEWDPAAFETRKREFRERLIQERTNSLLVSIIESRKQERGGLIPRWDNLSLLNVPLPPEAG